MKFLKKDYSKLLTKIKPIPETIDDIFRFESEVIRKMRIFMKIRFKAVLKHISNSLQLYNPSIVIEDRATLLYIDNDIVREVAGMFKMKRGKIRTSEITLCLSTYDGLVYTGEEMFLTFIHEVQHWLDVVIFDSEVHNISFYKRATMLGNRLRGK